MMLMMQIRGCGLYTYISEVSSHPTPPTFFVQKNRRHLWYADDQVNSIDLLLGSTGCRYCRTGRRWQ